ncbi:STM3941 family protein [Pseudoflavitalea rhizosphaerae]|uniref:STM3941 family protein n=1 Tax=Pseudoflavitalea rhizosphaerae TaxID=1884793 RepID=UPI000F8F33C7|nr:STM3941 family protein [Pseudoflavitalea rhizosphaerae]
MNPNKIVEIPLSKGKLIKGLAGSVIFVAASIWMLTTAPSSGRGILSSPMIKYSIAVSGIVFFGFMGLMYLIKLKDKKPGLVINENGIIDNSGGLAAGFIPWAEIEDFTIAKVMKQQFLVIAVKNPEFYIDSQKNILKKKGMQHNLSNYGSPIAISTNTLNCKLPDLLKLLEERNKV